MTEWLDITCDGLALVRQERKLTRKALTLVLVGVTVTVWPVVCAALRLADKLDEGRRE